MARQAAELKRVDRLVEASRQAWQEACEHVTLTDPKNIAPRVARYLDAYFDGLHFDSEWKANVRCPAHDDNNPSLFVSIQPDGKIRLNCMAYCEYWDVIEAAGLLLFKGYPIVAAYSYFDELGRLAYQTCKTANKQFPPRHLTRDGLWKWGRNGAKRILYRLPELISAIKKWPKAPVYICEGEKDVDRCWNEDLIATCCVGGAGGAWLDRYTAELAGRHVAILPDNDDAGRQFADRVASRLIGKAKSVKVLQIPGLPEKGDVSDYFDNGGTKRQLLTLKKKSPKWEPPERVEDTSQVINPVEMGAERTDLENARRYAQKHGGAVRFDHVRSKWLVYDGSRWVIDKTGEVERRGKEVADEIWRDGLTSGNQDAIKHAAKVASAAAIRNMIKLAESEPGIPVTADELDRHPMLLNCPNGTLDLESRELRPHRRDDMLTKLCPTEFVPDAESRLWRKALLDIFDNDESLIAFVQRFFGMCLTGDVREQVVTFLHGDGANGKTVFLDAVMQTIGEDYVIKAADEILMAKNSEVHPTAFADLFGVRMAVVMETDFGKKLSEGSLKALTGGDRVRARRMREDYWEFRPTHKIVLCTNHLPHVSGTDHAIWRRILRIPFNVTFTECKRTAKQPGFRVADKQLSRKLAAEREAILAWLVDGCRDWLENGLRTPEVMKKATEEYRQHEDVLGRFLKEKCTFGSGKQVQSSNLYTAYKFWCESNGETPLSLRQFADSLTDRKFERKKSSNTYYVGLSLRQSNTSRSKTRRKRKSSLRN